MSFRSAFSFTEVLFAVILLGIGFIMIAAIFPVAIRQSQMSLQETAGVSVAQTGRNYVKQLAEAIDFKSLPVDNQKRVRPLYNPIDPSDASDPLNKAWNAMKGNLIIQSDPRFAWVPVGYRILPNTNYAEVYIIAVASRNQAVYSDKDINPIGMEPANLQPKKIESIDLTNSDMGPDVVDFKMSNPDIRVPTEGAFIIIVEDSANEANNGRIYRLGNRISGTQFELLPGNDMKSDEESFTNGKALILGRGYAPDPVNPAQYGTSFEGLAQDLYAPPPIIVFFD